MSAAGREAAVALVVTDETEDGMEVGKIYSESEYKQLRRLETVRRPDLLERAERFGRWCMVAAWALLAIGSGLIVIVSSKLALLVWFEGFAG